MGGGEGTVSADKIGDALAEQLEPRYSCRVHTHARIRTHARTHMHTHRCSRAKAHTRMPVADRLWRENRAMHDTLARALTHLRVTAIGRPMDKTLTRAFGVHDALPRATAYSIHSLAPTRTVRGRVGA